MEELPIHKETEEGEPKTSRRSFLKLGLQAAVAALAMNEAACTPEKKQEKHVKYEAVSFDGGEAHKSGNDFANKVGNILEENWKNGQPSKVVNPKVQIFVENVQGKTEFKFSWHCEIEKCEAKDADRHFDRRGTLLSGSTLDEAKQKVEAELKSSGKVTEMMQGFDRVYGGHKMPHSFVSESSSETEDGKWWYTKEFFCTAK